MNDDHERSQPRSRGRRRSRRALAGLRRAQREHAAQRTADDLDDDRRA